MDQLDKIFIPRSIAIVGASGNPKKMSHWLVRNVVEGGYTGQVYAISRNQSEILGYPVYSSLKDLPQPVDLVLISVSGDLVQEVLSDASQIGAGAAVILSAGFGETQGALGKIAESRLVHLARKNKIRIMGPNCLGVFNGYHRLNGTFLARRPLYLEKISLVSQSGAMAGILIDESNKRKIGIGKIASVGNQADITHQEVVDYFGDDEQTEVIGLYLEGVKHGREFLATIERVSRAKPIVVFKAGRTTAGQRAANSHTGAMVGDYAIAKAALVQSGAVVVTNTEDFFDSLFALSYYKDKLPQNENLAIVTISGGPSVAASDTCEEIGLHLPQFEPETQKAIHKLLPPISTEGNPLDMTVSISKPNIAACVDHVIKDPSVSGVISINWGWDEKAFADAFVQASLKYSKPVLAFARENKTVQDIFHDHRILNLPSPERAVKSFKHLLQYNKQKCRPISQPSPPLSGLAVDQSIYLEGPVLNEFLSKKILSKIGLPCAKEALVNSYADASAFAGSMGYPVVLKVCSNTIIHKSEIGGVMTGLVTKETLRSAWDALTSRFPPSTPFLVQQQIPGSLEIMIGIKRDDTFGQTIAFGIGGIWTEVFNDVALRLCPISQNDAFAMIQEIRGYPLLKGYRGHKAVDEHLLCEILIRISHFAAANSRIQEMDINPLIVDGSTACIADAMIVMDIAGP